MSYRHGRPFCFPAQVLQQMTMTNTHERRAVSREFRAMQENGVTRLAGYAAVFNQWSNDLGGFVETILPGAFADVLKDNDVRALFNHSDHYVLGRTKSGTLILREDAVGLWCEVTLPDTAAGRDVGELVRRGDVDGMSFTFNVSDDGDNWAWGDNVVRRQISKVSRLWDVGPVTFPAYPQTSVNARSIERAQEVRSNGAGQAAGVSEREAEAQARRAFMGAVLRLNEAIY
jgi:uncharacterized protein